jgi:hypothetical protein
MRHILNREINWESDVDSDGEVNIFDLVKVARIWGKQYETDTTDPTIVSSMPSQTTLPLGTTTAIVGVETDERAVCRYNPTPTNFASMIGFDRTGGIQHTKEETGLSDNQNYLYYVQCRDEAGNLNSIDYLINFSVGSYGGNGGGNQTPTPYCGNTNCDANETCSSCEADCGECQPVNNIRLGITNTHFLTYNNQQVALFGMGNFWTLADPGVDYQDMILQYKNDGSNYMRMSLMAHTVGKRSGLSQVNVIYPFARSSTCCANDGGNKFDLTQFNPAWFNRLDGVSEYTQQNEVFLMYVIWDEIPLESGTARWIYNPFNPANNINNVGLPSTDAVTEFYDLSNTNLLNIQEAFLTEVLNTVAQYGNIFFGISNEYTGGTAWHQHWDTLIDNYETTSGYNPILTNELEQGGFSPAYTDLISKGTDQTGGPDCWRSDRPIVNYKTGPKFERSAERDNARKAWWSVFMNGGHTSDDSHDGSDPPNQHNSAETLIARAQIKNFRNFIERLPYNDMVPGWVVKSGLVSNGEARVKLGEEYVVYLDSGGSVDVDLSDASGTLSVEWYNPRDGSYTGQSTVQGGAIRSFTAPDLNDWALYLYK